MAFVEPSSWQDELQTNSKIIQHHPTVKIKNDKKVKLFLKY